MDTQINNYRVNSYLGTPPLEHLLLHPDQPHDLRDRVLLPHPFFVFLQFGEWFAALIAGYADTLQCATKFFQ